MLLNTRILVCSGDVSFNSPKRSPFTFTMSVLSYKITVNARMSARGAYSIFLGERGALIRSLGAYLKPQNDTIFISI